MSGTPAVRPARPADGRAIGRIQAQAWRETYPGLLPAEQIAAVDPVARGAMWTDAISRGIARGICVAEIDGSPIGFGACAKQRNRSLLDLGYTGEITAIYVLQAAQRRGAGGALMAALARRLIAEGDRAVALWVLTANMPARDFYARLGGEPIMVSADDHADETAYGWRDLEALAAGPNLG